MTLTRRTFFGLAATAVAAAVMPPMPQPTPMVAKPAPVPDQWEQLTFKGNPIICDHQMQHNKVMLVNTSHWG